jgi:hypothetical protein
MTLLPGMRFIFSGSKCELGGSDTVPPGEGPGSDRGVLVGAAGFAAGI